MKVALSVLICIHLLFLLFHFAVTLKLVSYKIVWGGRLTSDKQMYGFEAVSIIVTILILMVLFARAGYVNIHLPQQAIQASLWIITILYFFNTLGNLRSKNKFERNFFTPLTALMFILSLIVVLHG